MQDFRSENGLYALIQAQYEAAAKEAAARESTSSQTSGKTSSQEPEAQPSQSSATSVSDEFPEERPRKRQRSSSPKQQDASELVEDTIQVQHEPDNDATRNETTEDASSLKTEVTPIHQSIEVAVSEPRSDSSGPKETIYVKDPDTIFVRSKTLSPKTDDSPDSIHGARANSLPLELGSPSAATLSNRSSSPLARPSLQHSSPISYLRKRLSGAEHYQASDSSTSVRSEIKVHAGSDDLPSSPPSRPLSTILARLDSPFVLKTADGKGPLRTPLTKPHLASQFSSSPLSDPPLLSSSSPLSSPPPNLFDPYQEAEPHHPSNLGSSTTPSELDEVAPSSYHPFASSQGKALTTMKGKNLFESSIWSCPDQTSVFYTFATSLRRKVREAEPTSTHHFISHLRDRGKLVRCYTQNIDLMEEKVGLSTTLEKGPGNRNRFSRKSLGLSKSNSTLSQSDAKPDHPKSPVSRNTKTEVQPADEARRFDSFQGEDEGCSQPEKLIAEKEGPPVPGAQLRSRHSSPSGGVECVFLHGSLHSLRCFQCGLIADWDSDGREGETLAGQQPDCPHCLRATAAREEKGKRALGVGKLRPDIVLYGEEHPKDHLISNTVNHDLALGPDMLLILGTSLKVHGLKNLVRQFSNAVHSKGGKIVFVNFTKPAESIWGDFIDCWVEWDCDAWVGDLKDRIPLLWAPPGIILELPKKRKRDSTGDRENGEKEKKKGRKLTSKKPTKAETDGLDESFLPGQNVPMAHEPESIEQALHVPQGDKPDTDVITTDPSASLMHDAETSNARKKPKKAPRTKGPKTTSDARKLVPEDIATTTLANPAIPGSNSPTSKAPRTSTQQKMKSSHARRAREPKVAPRLAPEANQPGTRQWAKLVEPENDVTMSTPSDLPLQSLDKPYRWRGLREEKECGAYLQRNILENLARITGCSLPPVNVFPSMAACQSAAKAFARKKRRSAPASLQRPSPPTETPQQLPLPRLLHADMAPSSPGVAVLHPSSESGYSILDAIKSNPRHRKRKRIDGEEVVMPTVRSRPVKELAMARPFLPLPDKENREPCLPVKYPRRADGSFAVDIADIRGWRSVSSPFPKLEPLHSSSPIGPLTTLSPNMQHRRLGDRSPYFLQPLNNWPAMPVEKQWGVEDQLRSDSIEDQRRADAAMALSTMGRG